MNPFIDRADAGRKLGASLIKYRDDDAILYALPRGGVIVAAEVANILRKPLDLIIVRKIGHPYSPEFAIGAITENDEPIMDRQTQESIDPHWLDQEIEDQREEITRRRKLYLGDTLRPKPEGKAAIVIDDGAATGFTLLSAVHWLRGKKPAKIICALPVAPPDTIHKIKEQADDLIVLTIPEPFIGGVGYYYDTFPQVSDEEVIDAVRKPR